MNYKSVDSCPRILSFQQRSREKDGSESDILWPCNAFRVSLPSRKKRELNIFEETVLRLSSFETCDTKELSSITCLDKDLISFIQYRLNHLNYLNERFELTSHAKQILEEWDSEPEEFKVATIYMDLVGGKLLPVILSEPPKYEVVTECLSKKIKFNCGGVAKRKIVTARLIYEKDSFRNKKPHPDDIVKTIKAFKRLHKRFSLLTENLISLPEFYTRAEAVTIQEDPELVYLHCKIVVQKGNPDFLVTDPFGFGYSIIFKELLDRINAEWIIEIKEKACQEKMVNIVSGLQENNLPYFSEEIRNYPKIREFLSRAEDNWEKANQLVKSESQEKEFQNNVNSTFKYLYDALEWTFRQLVYDYPVEQWEKVFCHDAFGENDSLLNSLAQKIGLTIPINNSSILKVKKGNIKALSKGVVEMQSLLALAIAGAVQNNEHPLQRLAIIDNTCLAFIANLKEIRDGVAHGDITVKTLENLLYFRKRTIEIITALFPLLKGNSDFLEMKPGSLGDNDIDQTRLIARISLDRFFGLASVQIMPGNLIEALTRIELLQNEVLNNEIISIEYINSLASALQISLYIKVSEISSNQDPKTDLLSLALTKALLTRFTLEDETFPESLQTVNVKRIHDSCRGYNRTLGANLLAFLILAPEEKLYKISEQLPNFILFVDKIALLRGHGNNIVSSIHKDELFLLKEDTFKAIKLLMEN